MNPKKQQSINQLFAAVNEINNPQVKTQVFGIKSIEDAFLNTDDKAERKKLLNEQKKRLIELKRFLDDNPDVVNAEVERALLSAALGGEFIDEEIKISSSGKKSVKRVIKQIAPNVTAAAKWLENKDKENWSPNPVADPELEDTSDIEEAIYGTDKK